MEAKAVEILDFHRTMAISTVRADGWPQTTIVGYANDGLTLYFLISRASQKFENIRHDQRVSVAIGKEPREISEITAVYAGAIASEVTDPSQREHAWRLLMKRHPNLAEYEMPDIFSSALMRAECMFVSILDYTRGVGHTESLTVGVNSGQGEPSRPDDWGLSAVHRTIERPG